MKQKWKGSYACYAILFFFYYYCMSAFSSVLSIYLAGIGIGIEDLSWIVSASSIFGFVIIPIIGYLCDRTGKPRQIVGILMVGIGIFAVLFAVIRQVWILFLLNGLTMSCISAIMPVLERMAGAAKYRYGMLRIWGTIGYAVGAQAAGLIFQHTSPMLLFVSVLLAGILASAGIAGAEDPLTRKEHGNKDGNSGSVRSLFKNAQYRLFLMIAFLFWGCSGVNMTYLPLMLTDLGVDPGGIGTVIFFSTLMEIPIILYSHTFMDRFSSRILLWAACSLTLAEFVIYGFSRSVPVVVVAVVLMKALATTMYMMITLKTVRSLVPSKLITTGMAVVSTCNNVGLIFMQNMGGILVNRTSFSAFYQIMACIIAGIMLLACFLRTEDDGVVFG